MKHGLWILVWMLAGILLGGAARASERRGITRASHVPTRSPANPKAETPKPETTRPAPKPAAKSPERSQEPAEALQKRRRVFAAGPAGNRGWSDLRSAPQESADIVAQALLGDPLDVRAVKGEWARVSKGGKSAETWVRARDVVDGDASFARLWEDPTSRLVVLRAPGVRVSSGVFIPFGAVLPEAPGSTVRRPKLLLPDGSEATLKPGDALPPEAASLEQVLRRVRAFRRTRFQRGFNTAAGMDAGGLIQLVYRVLGRELSRDTIALHKEGIAVKASELRAGDVVFFEMFDPRYPHAVIVLDDGKTFFEAHPGNGVDFAFADQVKNRKIIDRRRYVERGPMDSE